MFDDALQFMFGGKPSIDKNKNTASKQHVVQNKPSLSKNSSVNNFTNKNKPVSDPIKRGTSFVIGQKLRESKWFTHEEMKILCAVIESGFIVEKQCDSENIFGIALWTSGFGKQKSVT